jgi:phage terminase large subunit-like protein
VWSNLLFGLRLGARPRVLITTTPRPIALLKELLAAPDTVVTRGTTYDNAANLPDSFFTQVIRRYEGTRLGRQELEGQILDDTPGALWTRAGLDACRTTQAAPPARIVVAIDPPATSGPQADACGIIVASLGRDGLCYVLADRTLAGASPTAWARAALEACGDFDADRLVAEVNNGGEMVETILRQIDPTVSYRAVRASHGKAARAEPVAALYEQGKVRHVAGLGALEDQMCAFSATFDRRVAGYSPDRVDALVWALTDLALSAPHRPAIRRLI